MNKIWIWLHKLSKKRIKANWNGTDIRCPNCGEWYSYSVAIGKDVKILDTVYGFNLECGNCKKLSNWNCIIAPVALPCDTNGEPI